MLFNMALKLLFSYEVRAMFRLTWVYLLLLVFVQADMKLLLILASTAFGVLLTVMLILGMRRFLLTTTSARAGSRLLF